MFVLENILGLSFMLVGLVSIASYDKDMSRFRLPNFIGRLKLMQERWGIVPGAILHFMAYVVTPFCFGLLFLFGVVF
jgi:hypothetical protein